MGGNSLAQVSLCLWCQSLVRVKYVTLAEWLSSFHLLQDLSKIIKNDENCFFIFDL